MEKIKMKLKIVLTILTALFMFGCSEDPNSVGKNVLDDQDKLKTSTDTSYATTSFAYPITSSNNSLTVMIGKSNNTEAMTLLQFGTFTVDTSIANSIISVKIKLIPKYSFKDTLGTLAFSIHKMNRSWSEYNFTIDSLPGSYDGGAIAAISMDINSKDTLTQFSFDKNLTSEWLKGSTNYGIILIPDAASNTVFGFSTKYYSGLVDERPQIEITYRRDTDTTDQTMVVRTQQDASVFSGTRPISTASLFYVQGGLINRGIIKFDTLAIPRSATITQAYLDLKVDTLESVFSTYTDYTIMVHQILANDSIPTLGGITATAALSAGAFTFDVRNIVQQWAAGKSNYGFALRSLSELVNVDKFAIYGFEAVPDSKPKLRIKYTYLP
jgi:hypothetical protein